MALSENTLSKISKSASRVVTGSLDALVPSVDMNPRKVDQIKSRVESIITSIVADVSQTLANVPFAGWLRNAALEERDGTVSSVLNSMAQVIACITPEDRKTHEHDDLDDLVFKN